MDKQQLKELQIALIEQLLNCPQGKEEAVLQANVELINKELLITIAAVAEQMEHSGHSNAGWLWQFGAQLERTLISDTDKRIARQFWVETMQLVEEVEGNPKKFIRYGSSSRITSTRYCCWSFLQ